MYEDSQMMRCQKAVPERVKLGFVLSLCCLFASVSFCSSSVTAVQTGNGNLLKRSSEETCHSCHKTNLNTPSVIGGNPNPEWDNAIKMHSAETLGACSNNIYKTRSECIDPAKGNGTWTPGKHASSGGWGVAGGTYGVFLCTTCHTAHDTKNIYLINEVITTPDGSNFQGRSSNNVAVDFRVTSGTAAVPGPQTAGIMGDDSSTHATSAFICEVCHTYNTSGNGVGKHAYNMSVTTAHNNGADCTSCHNHKKSFSGGGCTGCHGNPPQDGTIGPPGIASPATGITVPASAGAHALHSTTKLMLCEACHTGGMPASAVPSNTIDIGFTLNSTNVPNFNGLITTGTLNARSPAAPYTYGAAAGTTVNITTSDPTCSVYCHGSTMGSNNGTATTPSWTAASGSYSCTTNPNGACHGASAANPPLLGSHQKHAGASPNRALPCSDCHNGYVPPAASTTHVNNQSEFAFDTSKTYVGGSATYSGTPTMLDAYGSCGSLYCHSNVQTGADGTGAPTYASPSPTWGNASSGQCGTCHKGDGASGNLTLMDSGSHTKHVSTYGFGCNKCHKNAGSGTSKHGDYNIDISITDTVGGVTLAGTYSLGAAVAPGTSYAGATCSTVYCHSTGQATPAYQSPAPVWGTASSTTCGTCHGVLAGSPPASTPHAKHVGTAANYLYACVKCHSQTVDTSAANSNTAPGIISYGPAGKHVNGTRDVAFDSYNTGGSYTGTPATCNSIYCHSDGQTVALGGTPSLSSPPQWTGSTTCSSCHGIGGDGSGRPNYTSGSPNKKNSHMLTKHSSLSCDKCHYQTTTTGNSITNAASHVNKTYDVYGTGTAPYTFAYTYNSNGGTCSSGYCHGSAASPAWGTTGTLTCNSCHQSQGADNSTTSTRFAAPHEKHTSTAYYTFSCEMCHALGNTSNGNVSHVGGPATGGTNPGGDVAGANQYAEIRFRDNGALWSTGAYNGSTVATYKYGSLYATPFNGTGYPVISNPSPTYADGTGSASDVVNSTLKYTTTGSSCNQVWCHSNANPYNGPSGNVYASTAWSGTDDCGWCHNKQGDSSPNWSPPHTKHINTYNANTNFTCNACHANTASSNTAVSSYSNHVNGAKDIAWNSFANSSAPAYNLSLHQCQNVYCHGNGQTATPTVTVTWTGTYSTCGECHGNASTLTSGSHAGHLGGATCNNCHNATASSNTVISNYANHVNKSVTISLDSGSALSTATYNGAGNVVGGGSVYQKGIGTAYGSCTNIKCHSDGTAIWSGLTGAGSTPTWGPATAACNTCHGNSTYPSDYRIAAPLYASTTSQIANAKPNAHRPHVTVGAVNATPVETQCKHCHNTTTTDNLTTVNGGTHTNSVYNVLGGTPFTYASGENVSTTATVSMTLNLPTTYSTVTTCSGVSCHPNGVGGTKPAIAWNDTSSSYDCTNCHNIALTGTSTYHHSMNSTAYTPNPAAESDYPTSVPQGNWSAGANPTSRKCLMCHVKHNKFSDRMNASSSGRSFNLRTDITVAPTASSGYTNTDFISSGTYGICISCHNTTLTKDAGRQTAETGSTKTLIVSGADYNGSAHQYNVALTAKTGSTTFNANCSKCHDEQNGETAQFYTAGGNVGDMGTHDSTAKRLLGALGGTISADYEEQFCYRCHSRYSTDAVGGTTKPAANNDWYGVKTAMSAASQLIYNVVTNATYAFGHNPQNFSGLHKPADEGNNTSFYSTGIGSTLYLRNTATVNSLANRPGAYQYSSGTYFTDAYNQADMALTQGSTQASVALTWKTASNYVRGIQFVSPQLDSSVTIASGSVFTFTIRDISTATGLNARFAVYKWDGATKTPFNTTPFSQYGTGIGTTAANQTWTLTSNQSVTLNAGDSIICDVEAYTTTGSSSNKTLTFYFGQYSSDAAALVLPSGTYTWRTTLNADPSLSGSNRHIECTDCHDPHAAAPIASGVLTGTLSSYTNGGTTSNDTLTVSGSPWTANAYVGWTVKITEGTGAGSESVIFSNTANTLSAKFGTSAGVLNNTSKFIIYKAGTSDGNLISNPSASIWGVTPSSWPVKSPSSWNDVNGCGAAGTSGSCEEIASQFGAALSWTRTESATTQGMICIKCHSSYAYGSTPPNTPSAQPNGTNSTGSNNVSTATMKQGDKAQEFNPNNLGFHPIFARGMNQPVRANYGNTGLVSAVNTNWPLYSAGSISVTNGAATLTGASLPSVALPGWFVYIGATAPTSGAATGASNNQTPGTSSTGYLEITSITDSTHFTVRAETSATSAWPNPTYNITPTVASTSSWFLTAGLGNTFVPPFGPWSTMQCTDCHMSDTSSDPMGPHGSAYKYLLIKSTAQIFSAMTANNTVAYGITNTPTDGDNFCLNCHRRDVYGDYSSVFGAYKTYARVTHPMDTTSGQAFGTKPTWGPVCMNCHGGARAGAIHGQNLGKGNSGAAGSYSGKRLLAGAYWTGVTRSTRSAAGSCYVKGSADAVSNCSNGNQGTFGGTGTTANYQFDDSTP